MTLLNNTSQQQKHSEDEVRPFRSEIQSMVVGNTTLKITDLSRMRPDEVKVSEFRLEQYLNACCPTCHG